MWLCAVTAIENGCVCLNEWQPYILKRGFITLSAINFNRIHFYSIHPVSLLLTAFHAFTILCSSFSLFFCCCCCFRPFVYGCRCVCVCVWKQRQDTKHYLEAITWHGLMVEFGKIATKRMLNTNDFYIIASIPNCNRENEEQKKNK